MVFLVMIKSLVFSECSKKSWKVSQKIISSDLCFLNTSVHKWRIDFRDSRVEAGRTLLGGSLKSGPGEK